MALDAITPVAATEKTAARSNPFVKISCVVRDFINQWRSNLHIMTYTRYFGTKYFIMLLQYDTGF
jgi:hypothetical protein